MFKKNDTFTNVSRLYINWLSVNTDAFQCDFTKLTILLCASGPGGDSLTDGLGEYMQCSFENIIVFTFVARWLFGKSRQNFHDYLSLLHGTWNKLWLPTLINKHVCVCLCLKVALNISILNKKTVMRKWVPTFKISVPRLCGKQGLLSLWSE